MLSCFRGSQMQASTHRLARQISASKCRHSITRASNGMTTNEPTALINTNSHIRHISTTPKMQTTSESISEHILFKTTPPPPPADQILDLSLSVALVAPQQSLNVGAVARLMANFGHTDLYISQNDGGIDAMLPAQMTVDTLEKETVLCLAPMLQPIVGHHSSYVELQRVLSLCYKHAESVDASSSFVNTHILPSIIRIGGLGVDLSTSDLVSALTPHVRDLLPFLSPQAFAKLVQDGLEIHFYDRMGARVSGSVSECCSIYHDMAIEVNTHTLLTLINHDLATHNHTGLLPSRLPETISFSFPIVRAGVPVFKGIPTSQWHPDVVTSLQHSLTSGVDVGVGVGDVKSDTLTENTVSSESDQALHQPSRLGDGDDTALQRLPLARDCAGVALSTHAYYTATKMGASVLDNARVFGSLDTLLQSFDIVIGTSALAKPQAKPKSQRRNQSKTSDDGEGNTTSSNMMANKSSLSILPDCGQIQSGKVLRPWELSQIIVDSVINHQRAYIRQCDGTQHVHNQHDQRMTDGNRGDEDTVHTLNSLRQQITSLPHNTHSETDMKTSSCHKAPPLRVLLVMGRETSGLTASELAMCDYLVTIPGPSPIGSTLFSLNLSHATGVLLYELSCLQQRLQQCDVRMKMAGDDRGKKTVGAAIDQADDIAALKQEINKLQFQLTAVKQQQQQQQQDEGLSSLTSPFLRSRLWRACAAWISEVNPTVHKHQSNQQSNEVDQHSVLTGLHGSLSPRKQTNRNTALSLNNASQPVVNSTNFVQQQLLLRKLVSKDMDSVDMGALTKLVESTVKKLQHNSEHKDK